MRKIPGYILAFWLIHSCVYGQDAGNDLRQPPTLGIHFIFDDFKSAAAIRASSLGSALRNGQFGKLKDMAPGLTIGYIQGLSPHVDFSTTLAGSFADYLWPDGSANGADHFLLEGDVSLRGKLFTNKHWVTPYLQVGIGASSYTSYYGAFIPAGIGIQMNFFGEAFLTINSQYRIPVTPTTNYHFFHSIGLAGVIGHLKAKKPLSMPPLPQQEVAVERDADGDGIPDSRDACPYVKGEARFDGCPDTDGDGIPDKDDKCPREKGLARYQGCPIPDSDGDGINDEEDKCPHQKGVGRYFGCPVPDRDSDGVSDEEDRCPDLPGTVANHGCPEVKEALRKKMDTAAKHIFFATGSYKLLPVSFRSLDEVAGVMREDSALKLDIAGHTDNVGSAAKNLLLSEQRAEAVLKYLRQQGIASDRLKATGYGETRPVADNATIAGRAANRRVVLALHYD